MSRRIFGGIMTDIAYKNQLKHKGKKQWHEINTAE